MNQNTSENAPVIDDEYMADTLASLSAQSRALVFLLAHRLRDAEQEAVREREARRAGIIRRLAQESTEGVVTFETAIEDMMAFSEAPGEDGETGYEVSDTLPPPRKPDTTPPPPPPPPKRRK